MEWCVMIGVFLVEITSALTSEGFKQSRTADSINERRPSLKHNANSQNNPPFMIGELIYMEIGSLPRPRKKSVVSGIAVSRFFRLSLWIFTVSLDISQTSPRQLIDQWLFSITVPQPSIWEASHEVAGIEKHCFSSHLMWGFNWGKITRAPSRCI